jgi:DNA-binding transcriptional regulator YhcF (GntR family)
VLWSAPSRASSALIFDFYNYTTGRLDPSYEAIAAKARCSQATVARCLAALKRLGVLDWQRRCTGVVGDDGRYQLEQDTNAYRL